jgi:fibronectin-binding autotransporter adhesin
MRIRNALNIVLAIAMVMAPISTAGAADLTWTGGGDGESWADAANWGGTAPADIGDTLTIDNGDTIIDILRPAGGNYTAGSTLRSVVNLDYGTMNINSVFETGRPGIFNIGDGVLTGGSADAIVDLTAKWEFNRHDSGTYVMNILADGELNATGSGYFQTYSETNRNWNINIDGGLMTSEADWVIKANNGPNNNLLTLATDGTVDVGAITVQTGDVIDFADTSFTSFTADFGGSFADLAAVNSAIGTTFTATGGSTIVAVDKGDGTFRVGIPVFGASETATWIGGAAGNWNEAAKWSTGTVPFYTDNANGTAVTIGTPDVTVSDLQAATSVDIAAAGQLDVAAGGALAVHYGMTNAGQLSVTGGALTVDGGLTSTSATATNINAGGTLTLDAGALTDVTIGTGNGTISTTGVVEAGALSISDNSTLIKNGAGKVSFSGVGVIGTTGTGINVNAGHIALAAAPAGVNTITLNGGTFETSGTDNTVYSEGLAHYGYHTGPNGVMDLNNNNAGGMMGGGDPTQGPTFFGQSILTDGPRSEGLYFDGDGNFTSTGSVGQNDNYSNMWLGVLTPDVSGDWVFKSNQDDDRVGIWIDLDQDGVFESTSAGLGSDRGEQLMWEQNNTNKTVSLTAGQEYMVAFTHSEGGGGSRAGFQFQSPDLTMRYVKPGDAAQAGLWQIKTPGTAAINMATTDFTVTANSNMVATTDTTATFGALTLTSGIANVTGVGEKTIFGAASAAAGATTGITANSALELGALTIGAGADVTLGGTTVTAPSIDVDTSATIRVIGDVNPGTYNEGAAATALTLAGTGSLDLSGLGAAAATGTTFKTQESATLILSGDTPLGGSTAALQLDGGTIRISGGGLAAPAGAIASWMFDETSGTTAADSSGNGHNGTLNGGVVVNQAARPGSTGTSFYFDGSDDFINVPAGIDIANKSFTLSAWVKREAPASNDYIMGQGPGPNNLKLHFGFRDADNATLAFYSNDADHANDPQYSDTTGWHQLTATYDVADNARHIYWDGVDQTPLVGNFSGPFEGLGEFLLGQANNGYFQGWLDDMYIYDSAMSQAEVIGLYSAGGTGGAISLLTTNVDVSDDSTLEAITASTATLGSLNFTAAKTLTTTGAIGSIIFADTTLAAGDNGFNTLSNTAPGAISVGAGVAATIVKTGAADLVLDPSEPTIEDGGSLAWDVREGRLVAQAGSNPLVVGSPVEINGGEVVLVSSALETDATFDNPITSTGGTLTAGANGGSNVGPLTVTVGNDTGNNLTLSSGTLNVQTTDGYTLNIAGNVSGSGDMTIGAGSTVITQGTTNAGVITIDGSLETNDNVTVRGLVANAGGVYAATGTNRNLTVTETLTLNSGIDMSSATLNVDGANVTVKGLLQVGNNLGTNATPVANVDVSEGGGLTLNGNSLTTQRLLTTGISLDMKGTGSFIATGDVAILPAGGPTQVELTGGSLTIGGGGVSYADVVQGDAPKVYYQFDDAAGSNTAANTGSDASFGGAVNGTITFETPSVSSRTGTAADLGTDGWLEPGAALNDHLGFSANSTLEYFIKTDYAGNGDTSWRVTALYGGDDSQRSGRVGTGPEWWWGTLHDGKVGATGGEGIVNFESNTAINDDVWHHVAMTRDGTNFKVYIDGVLDKESNSFNAATDGYYYDEIGRNQNLTTSHLDAAIDELAIYNVTLSAEDIAAHYAAATSGGSGDAAVLPGTNLLMSSDTTLDINALQVTLGALDVTNAASPVTLTFTGAAENRINLASTTFSSALSGDPGLIIDATSKVNLGALNLAGAIAPVINKVNTGQWIITDAMTEAGSGYTGGVTYNVAGGTMVLGDSGLIDGPVNVADGAALKLSSTSATQTYNETIVLTGTTAILAGMADSNAATTAVVTLPTLPTDITKSVTLGTTDAGYTLDITNTVAADTLTIGGVGTVKLTAGGSVNNAIVGSAGTVNVAAPLTVATQITLGAVDITDDAVMQIVGDNLANPSGTLTLNGTAPVIWAGSPDGGAGELRLDFSSGTLDGWNVGVSPVGDNAAFTTGKMPWDRGGGNFAVKTDQNGLNDATTGIIRSDPFTLFGGTINFVMAGGNQAFSGDPDTPDANMLAVTLERQVAEGDWEMVESANGTNYNDFRAKSWDTSAYDDGGQYRIGIYDTYAGGWGKVGMDDMVISAAGGAPEGVALDMPNLNIVLTNTVTNLTLASRSSATLGDLATGPNADLTIVGTNDASFNNVTVKAATPTTINNGGAEIATTVRGALSTAGSGGNLTTAVTFNGDLTMAAGSSTSVVGGAITANTLNHAGGANSIDAASSVSVTNLNVTGGTLNAAAPISVSTQATIGEHVVAANTGNAFGVSGTDVLAAHTLTLNGGVMTLSGETVTVTGGNMPSGLVGLWTFDDSTGADTSGNGYNGSQLGSVSYSNTDTPLGTGNSLDLTGGDAAITVADTDNAFDGGQSMTIAYWAKGNPGSWSPFVSKNGENDGWQSRKNNNNAELDWTARGGPGGDWRVSNTAPATNGQWHFIVMTYDGVTRETYLNGADMAGWVHETNASTGDISASSNMMVFGARDKNNDGVESWLNGKIDDVYFFDRAINQTEVELLYSGNASVGATMDVTMLTNTTISAAVSSDVTIDNADAIELGGIETAAGATLTVNSPATTIALTNLTMGGGSMVRSTQAASVSNVDVTAASVTLSGGMNYLGDATQLGDPNGDSNSTNLTLSDGAIIDWTFDGSGGNTSYLDVKGDITLDGTLRVNVLDGIGTAGTEDIFIMMARGTIFGDVNDVTIDTPAGWAWDSFAIEQRSPSTWALVLKNAVFGVTEQDAGDTNNDGFVDDVDLANFELAFGLDGAELIAAGFAFDPDFDNDGDADLDDFATLRQFFGTDYNDAPAMPDLSQTPEPATMSLLALGALAILRRRRRK